MMKRNRGYITRRVPGNHQFPIALSDMVILMLVAIWYMFSIAAINMNPKHTETAPPLHVPPGVVQTMITWPDVDQPGGCADIDLWMQSPYDTGPVGYANPRGIITNLLRDDQGCINNPIGKNFEIDQTHGIPSGEYVVNLHYFDNHAVTVPVKIHVVIDILLNKNDTLIFDKWFTMVKKDEVVTVAVFDIDQTGHMTGIYSYEKDIVPAVVRTSSESTGTETSGSSGVR